MARNFYADDQSSTPLPGTVVAASDAQIEALGPNRLINGSSIRSPSALETPLTNARAKINTWINTTQNKVDDITDKFHTTEEHFTSTIANLHYREEDLVTSCVYVLVAGLSGTILTRRSNVVLKAIVPLILGGVAFKYTSPGTFNNTASFAYDLERTRAPQLVEKQDKLITDAESAIAKAVDRTQEAEKAAGSKFTYLKDAFKKFTGLRIGEDVTK